ncbi:FAD-binding oxidoreductase [Pandoraea pulmonicola]|nr:FAD-binding oxidoreductase [Pandoraea pulmonicola]
MPIGDVVVEALGVCATPGRPVVKTGGRVLSVDRVSGDVSVVQLQLPPDSGFRFAPGQYIDVVLRDGTRRSYSMANQPGEDGHVELHVRAVPGGRFSQHVYQRLKPRDLLRVEGPFGSFLLNPTRLPVVLVASGTGYAPIASFLRSHHDALQARGVAFYWGGHREADLYAIDEMRRWEATSENFRFVPVLSSPEDSWRGRTGFVHLAVQEDIPDLSAFEVYACGNPLMIEAARTSFVAKSGLAPDRFFSDAFVIAAPAASRA